MKRHLRLSTKDPQARDAEAAVTRIVGSAAGAAPEGTRLALVRTRPWTHTLVLRGRLDEWTAPDLEDEIECLREEGVTSLTLDLRQLDAIDGGVMAAIASAEASFRRRGRQFSVLPAAALRGGLAGENGEVLVHPFAGRPSPGDWEVSTTMVRELGPA
jgi:ABC-type transporter Mla MlaB component